MISASPKHKVFLAIDPIDFRKGIDSISSLCRNKYHQSPQDGHYFIFRNKRKTDIKLIYYDSQGYCLFQKRLSTGKFKYWPTTAAPVIKLTPVQLQGLLFNGDPQNIDEGLPWQELI